MAPTVRSFGNLYVVGLSLLGPLLLGAVLLTDLAWAEWWREFAIMLAATVLLRSSQLALGKYAYVSQVGVVALAGTILAGPAPTVTAIGVGVVAADWLIHRKHPRAAWINASREVLSLVAAVGFYAATLAATGAPQPLSLDGLPALAILTVSYFVISRALFYYTLAIREKLTARERLFVLRYEIVAYGLTLGAAGAVLLTFVLLPPVGWPFVIAPVLFAALIFRRLLEEAIQAEELNKIQGMELVVTSNARLEDALGQIEWLAHRILDWRDFRVLLRRGEQLTVAYHGRVAAGAGIETPGGLEELRDAAVTTREPVVVQDAERDPRAIHFPAEIRSLVIQPLLFGNEVLGTLELDHHKRWTYGRLQLALIETCARRIATVVRIAGLRKPLLDTVERVGAQVRGLGELAEALGSSASAMATSTEAIGCGLEEQDAVVAEGLDAARELSDATQQVVVDSSDAARASGSASEVAERHRRTIREAMERLVALESFVAESSGRVTELSTATRRIVKFLASIRELADLTNLLALNAAIEAARAGTHGRGFAEVAREVRSLAEQSAQATLEAGQLVEEMQMRLGEVVEQIRRGQAAVGGVEKLSTEGLEALAAIVGATHDATEHAQRIAETAEGQNAALLRLGERIGGVAQISTRNRADTGVVLEQAKEIARGVDEMGRASRELDAVAAILADLTRRVTAGESDVGF
ncbi:MAG: GAF domain-containing protein [Gemmatimonadales bacterium]|nr:GAF domain-containing protein [Gemmatimonadales bacterium]NIN12482.1 GAF domain-containing protein [Gemmatimonadales bacterium]NIN50858.1 GAF domain-containing protein [Gemmatimonadales bacterium]NIP08322.1 GAF domain-containing protein [Gemmatimonadales bacterium]NIR00846.1 GAF domain-containing protein [Gemmatimonadales bacterium]